MYLSAQARKLMLYSAAALSLSFISIQTLRLLYAKRSLAQQILHLRQETTQLKHIEQYTDAINYINSETKIQDFSSMLNFRLHDISYVKLLHSRDEVNHFKRKVQITCRTIEQLKDIIYTLLTLDSCICYIDKFSYERSKDLLIVTLDLTYIH